MTEVLPVGVPISLSRSVDLPLAEFVTEAEVQQTTQAANRVAEHYAQNPTAADAGIISLAPLIEALAALVTLAWFTMEPGMVAVQNELKEKRSNGGKVAFYLELCAFLSDFSTLMYLITLIAAKEVTDSLTEAIVNTFGFLFIFQNIAGTLESLSGFGNPDRGEEFDSGSAKFSGNIYNILSDAMPSSDSWVGASADAYAHANEGQIKCVKLEFAEADNHVARVVSEQSEQVLYLRQALAGLRIAADLAINFFLAISSTCTAPLPFGRINLEVALKWISKLLIAPIIAAIIAIVAIIERTCFEFVSRIRESMRSYAGIVHYCHARKGALRN